MRSQTLLFFCILMMSHGVLGEVWEFGVDTPGSVIVDHREGVFSLFQKTKNIKLRGSNFLCRFEESDKFLKLGINIQICGPAERAHEVIIVDFSAPHCYELEYVRVQIYNPISNPNVMFSELMNMVTIEYNPLQYSVSEFNIIAKAARMPGCYNQDMEAKIRHKFGR